MQNMKMQIGGNKPAEPEYADSVQGARKLLAWEGYVASTSEAEERYLIIPDPQVAGVWLAIDRYFPGADEWHFLCNTLEGDVEEVQVTGKQWAEIMPMLQLAGKE